MDGKGRALDNLFTERLWRTVKYEEVYLHDYLSPREARQALTRYFTFYNQERLHQALDYQTPAEVYFSVPPSVSRLSDVHEEREFVLAPDVVESTREQASEERRHL
jgi:hypothetical protein